jgi:FAD/FMN-containing dehydrogenase
MELRENVELGLDPLSPYLTDASGYRGSAERVLTPADEAEAARILQDASAQGVPVTIAGAGTGLTGGRVPEGGWVLSLERLNRIEIRDGVAICGAGAILRDVQHAAAAKGLLYPPDPTEWMASIGGTIATNASGSRSFLYGPTRRYVKALHVALPSGELLHLARGKRPPFALPALPVSRARKNTAGYYLRPGMDYPDLFIGSEGTLGVITEAELELIPNEAELFAGVVFFESDAAALDGVDRWRAVPKLRMLEYIDAGSLELLRAKFREIPAAARAALLMERAGEDWMPDAGMEASWFAASPRDRERFREFRHALPEAVNDVVRRRGLRKMGSDFAVPVERNREMLAFYREVLDREFPGRYVIFGHIGDAHLHVNVLPASEAEWEHAKELMIRFARRAVELGGTVSAEHGLGKGKRHLLEIQFTPAEIEAMKSVKRMLDPKWILGRGTLFAPEAG